MQLSIPTNTQGSNDCHFEKWKDHCAVWGCATPIRDNYDAMSGRDPIAHRSELDLASSFVMSRYLGMKARAHGEIPKVDSAIQSYLAVARAHNGASIPKLPMTEIRRLMKGIANKIILDHGIEVLLPSRKQPINNATHAKLMNDIPEGTKIGPFVFFRSGHFGRSWRRLLKVLNRTGFRKGEWAVRKLQSPTHMTYRQIAYCFDGSDQPVRRPTMEQLQSLRGEVWLYLYPVPSKCDTTGKRFCTKAIPFRLNKDDPDDVVSLFIQEEIQMHRRGLSDAQRGVLPLFSNEDDSPLLASAMDRALRDALALFVPHDIASHLSWHSYRVRLACKLKAAGKADSDIKAAVRWSSDDALATYARWERADYAAALDAADAKDTTSVQFTALPEIDEGSRS